MGFLRRLIFRMYYATVDFLSLPGGGAGELSAASQVLLQVTYRQMQESGLSLPRLQDVGFQVYSQADEDGILLYIFSLIGTTNKRCVELGTGDGTECNTANLRIKHGWTGLLVDCKRSQVGKGQVFFQRHRSTYVFPPTMLCVWLTRENVNTIVRENGFEGEIDLLSIDVRGIDYWLWDALDVIRPRVVVIDNQDILGPDIEVTVPYDKNFRADDHPTTRGMPNFSGASLAALVKLGKKKGYRLVGCNRYGFNAFFVRNDLGAKELVELSTQECQKHPKVVQGIEQRFPEVKDHPWVKV